MSSNMSSSKRSQGDNRHGSQLSGAHLNQDQESKLDYGIDQTDVLLPRCRAIKKPYITFDRPHPEYAQSVWSLHLDSQIKQLEHSDRWVMLDLPTLLYRRERGDMIGNGDHFNTYDQSTLPKIFNRFFGQQSAMISSWQGIERMMASGAHRQIQFILLSNGILRERSTCNSGQCRKHWHIQSQAQSRMDKSPKILTIHQENMRDS